MKTHAMTLRIPDDLYERLRTEAFNKRVSITSLVVRAIEKAAPGASMGCDSCGAPYVYVTTPGGFRFCEEHMPGQRPALLVEESRDSGSTP